MGDSPTQPKSPGNFLRYPPCSSSIPIPKSSPPSQRSSESAMDEGPPAAAAGGPAPFLLKTYDMVDDAATDEIVSWSPANTSFVVWNSPDFAARLLPTYFKHNNFSSFIRQLNTYGFRKIHPERWEFANEDFVRGQKHLLKNIHRRKPIHSHSNPPGGLPDPERAALEEEIERLSREKAALQADLWRFKQQQSGTKIQLEDLNCRMLDMEQRQLKMIAFLERAFHNPKFIENLVRMAGVGSEDFSAISKKRRLLPGPDYCQDVTDNSTSRSDAGQVFNLDFSDKLKLELCPAISESNLVSGSTQSSNGDIANPPDKQSDRMECLSLVPEPLELSDTGASFCPRKSLLFPRMADEGDGIFPCHLNLTLASCSMQVNESHLSDRSPSSAEQVVGDVAILRATSTSREDELGRVFEKNQCSTADSVVGNMQALQEATPTSNQAPSAPTGRVNDVFWEQFLTERPGDTEEASSSLRENPYDKLPQEKLRSDDVWRNRKYMERLSL